MGERRSRKARREALLHGAHPAPHPTGARCARVHLRSCSGVASRERAAKEGSPGGSTNKAAHGRMPAPTSCRSNRECTQPKRKSGPERLPSSLQCNILLSSPNASTTRCLTNSSKILTASPKPENGKFKKSRTPWKKRTRAISLVNRSSPRYLRSGA